MTAQSPYSVARRNSYLSKRSSSSSFSSTTLTTSNTSAIGRSKKVLSFVGAFFWFIIRYWKRQKEDESLYMKVEGNDNERVHNRPGGGGGENVADLEQFFVTRRAPLLAAAVRYMKYGASNTGGVVESAVRSIFSIVLPSPSSSTKSLPPPIATRKTDASDTDADTCGQQQSTTRPLSADGTDINVDDKSKKENNSNSSRTTVTENNRSSGSGSIAASNYTATNNNNNYSNNINANSAIQRIYENQTLIRKILNYWFGQYNIDNSQKMLWMMSNSSIDLKKRVDLEIYNEFLPILQELLSSSKEKEDDSYNGSNNNNGNYRRRYSEWNYDYDSIYGIHGKIATIIVLDQFSRHIFRYCTENNAMELLNFKQTDCDLLALQTAELLFEKHTLEVSSGSIITLPMYVFSLMPYRHTKQLSKIRYVQDNIENIAASNYCMMNDNLLRRFRKATNRRVALLQDELRRTGGGNGEGNHQSEDKKSTSETSMTTAATTTTTTSEEDGCTTNKDVTPSVIKDEDILETFPFDADMILVTHHPVYRTIVSFLLDRGLNVLVDDRSGGKNKGKNNDNKERNKQMIKKNEGKQMKQQQKQSNKSRQNQITDSNPKQRLTTPGVNKRVPIIISLSGGVDSMVIISVLSRLQKQLATAAAAASAAASNGSGGLVQLHIIAVHIDYANRPESLAEANYVRKYCEQMLSNVTFYCRRIDEITRGITSRDDYERMSRDIRYDMYKYAMKEATTTATNNNGTDNNAGRGHSEQEIGVMLGHHRGDLRENVLSNAHKGCGPLDLSGMTSVSQNNGVTIYRPLLPLEKDAIYDYAHKFGVPYFKDTTPHWSTRGKLRNKLLPLLEEIYGEGSMNNLSTLATESDDCRDLLNQVMIGPFMDQVIRKPMGIMFDTAPWKDNALFFWKFVLREMLHSVGLGMFTDKSVISFLERVQVDNIRPGWLQCRKDYAVYLQATGRVCVFYPSSFPFRKQDKYEMENRVVEYGPENAIQVGPWKVQSELVQPRAGSSQVDSTQLLAKKAVPSMDSFMDAELDYYLSVPTTLDGHAYVPQPLVLSPEFSKASRPSAWKNTDLKIQSTLPILGIDERITKKKDDIVTSLANFANPQDNPIRLVRITLRLSKSN